MIRINEYKVGEPYIDHGKVFYPVVHHYGSMPDKDEIKEWIDSNLNRKPIGLGIFCPRRFPPMMPPPSPMVFDKVHSYYESRVAAESCADELNEALGWPNVLQ